MKLAVIGCGSIGQRHIRNLFSLGCNDIVGYDSSASRREYVLQNHGIKAASNLQQALDFEPQAALICTPPVSHGKLAFEFAKKGCHLFIEKPLSHNLDYLDLLEKEVDDRQLVTLIGCNFKFHPSFVRMKQILSERQIGNILSARCQFGQYLPDWHPWEDYRLGYSARSDLGGGILLDSHEFDYLSWFLGDIKKVVCFAGKKSSLDIDTEDTAAVLLEFACGTIGEMHLDYTQRTYQRNYELMGEEGTLKWDFNEKKILLYTSANKAWQEFSEPAGYDFNQMYIDELEHFLDCVRNKKKSITNLLAGKKILGVILAAKESALSGRVIEIA